MNSDTSLAGLTMLIAAIGVIILILVIPAPAHALECQERPDKSSYWSYRIIDSEKCWYRGHRVWPKSKLHWPKQKPQRKYIDPLFHIRAEVKTVRADELNELDMQAQAKPLFMFPEIDRKIEALLDLWRHRWDTK